MAYLVDVTLDGSGLFGQIGPFRTERRAIAMAQRVERECRRRGISVSPFGDLEPERDTEIQIDIVETWEARDWRMAVPE